MRLESIDIDEAVTNAKRLLKQEQGLSPALAASMELILLLISLLANRLKLNSRNSSKPPSTDPNRHPKTRDLPGQENPADKKAITVQHYRKRKHLIGSKN